MSFLAEFRKFALRGNVVDMAVGIIIGAAFGRIVTSLVNDVIMPPLGMLTGRVDFSNLYINLANGTYPSLAEAQKAGAPTINYGMFLNNVMSFLLVAFAVFWLIKLMNSLARKEEAAPAATPPDVELLREIRDILKEK